jgi:uncharacterized protein (TIRG00374 family)
MEEAVSGPGASVRRKLWQVLSWVLGVGLAVVALLALDSQRGELSGALADLASLRPLWVVVAAAAELFSMLAFAFQQEVLLDAAGRPLRRRWLVGFTFAGNSVNNSFPAGSALATAWAYRQLRRQGATEAVASWELVALVVSSGIGLGLLVAGALVLPGSTSVVPGLGAVAWPFLGLTVLAGAAWLRVADLVDWARARRRASRSESEGSGVRRPLLVRASQLAERWLEGIAAIRPSLYSVALAMVWSLLNWGLDAGCLALSFVALGARVPWPGLLVAYGAGQLASNLPITPGGIGVVEGSLVIALVAFGGAHDATVAAVLLYRLLSFWLLLPVGWLCWIGLRRSARREGQSAAVGGRSSAPLRSRRRRRMHVRFGRRRRASASVAVTGSLVGLGLLLGGCAAPRQVLGTPTNACLRALPVAEAAVGDHARLLAVHLRARRTVPWLPAPAVADEHSVCVVVLQRLSSSSSSASAKVEVVVETKHWSVVGERSLPDRRRSGKRH